jgi:hypothetical protein
MEVTSDLRTRGFLPSPVRRALGVISVSMGFGLVLSAGLPSVALACDDSAAHSSHCEAGEVTTQSFFVSYSCSETELTINWYARGDRLEKLADGSMSLPRVFECSKDDADEDCVSHEVAETLLAHDLVLVQANYEEGEDFKLIELRTGQVSTFDAEPQISPSGFYALELSSSTGFDEGPAVRLYQRNSGTYRRVLNSRLGTSSEADFKLVSWVEDECLVLDVEAAGSELEFSRWRVKLWKTSSGWKSRRIDDAGGC